MVQRKVKKEIEIPKPFVADLYTSKMGDVDQADQLWSYYYTGQQTKKWYWYLWWFLVNVFACAMVVFSSTITEGITSDHSCSFISCWPKNWSTVSRRESDQCKERVVPQTVDQLRAQRSVRIDGRKKQCVHCNTVGRKPRKATQKNPTLNAVLVKFACVKRHASGAITISDRLQACRPYDAFKTDFLVLFVSFLTWNIKITILYFILSFWNIILIIRH